MTTIRQIMQQMDQVAELLAGEEPRDWPGWVCYLLEALDNQADDAEFRAVLEQVKQDIDTRLTGGRW